MIVDNYYPLDYNDIISYWNSHKGIKEMEVLMTENYDSKNICLCKKISKEKMVEVINDGAKTVNRIKYKTGAGSGACKGRRCTPKIEKLLKETL